MQSKIIQIGNSKGVRIPASILKECALTEEITMDIVKGSLIIKPLQKNPRSGWNESFQSIKLNDDDKLVIDDLIDIDDMQWEW